MEFLELFIRVAGVTLLLMLAAFCARDGWKVKTARFGFLLSVSLTAVLATSISTESFAPPPIWRYALAPLGSSTAIFIWWFCLSLFDDEFRLGVHEWGVAALWTGLGLFVMRDFVAMTEVRHEWAAIARGFVATGLVAHIVYVAFKGRGADLVEDRRSARIFIAISISILFLFDLFSERVFNYFYTPLGVNIVQLAAFLAVVVWSVFWLLRLDATVIGFAPRRTAPTTPTASLTAKEAALHSKLNAAMDEEKAYLDPALSIGALAERLAAPEHQLRALINKSMGHRNFRSFLNGYRMIDARTTLADPDKAATPILTIAMDSGFASLASFNRAFKSATGSTPSEFRNAALSANSNEQS